MMIVKGGITIDETR